MTARPTRPRIYLLGTLGLALSALLNPSGKIISSAAAAAVLAGGVATLLPPPAPPAIDAAAPTSGAPAHVAYSGTSAPEVTYIEVDGLPLPVVLVPNPIAGGDPSGESGPASASPASGPSGGGGALPQMGSPRIGQGHRAAPLPGAQPDASEASPSDGPIAGDPSAPDMPVSSTPRPPLLTAGADCAPAAASTPNDASPGASQPEPRPCASIADPDDAGGDHGPRGGPGEPLASGSVPAPHPPRAGTGTDSTPLAGSLDPAGGNSPSDAGAPASPQGEPGDPPQPFLGTESDPQEAPQPRLPAGLDDPRSPILASALPASQGPAGTDDPLNPPVLGSAPPETLLAGPGAGPSPSPAANAASVPEPAMIGLMLPGLAAWAWTGRRRPTAARRA